MFKWLFGNGGEKMRAYTLYTKLVEQSRQPVFYTDFEVDDTLDGRFDMIVLHVFLYLRRLERMGDETKSLRQQIMEALISDMDRALREIGVGDMGVGKQVKTLGGGMLGRIDAYGKALDSETTAEALEAALTRNLYRDREVTSAPDMGRYMIAFDRWLDTIEDGALVSAEFTAPEAERFFQGKQG